MAARALVAPNGGTVGSRGPSRWLGLVSILVLAFLCLPVIIVVAMSFSSAKSLEFPPPGLSLRWYGTFFGDSRWLDAGTNSVLLAGLASTIALLLGTVASYALLRGRFPGRRLIEANFMAPIIVPSIITAVALFIAFARTGVRGTFGALVLAHTILVVPYVVLIMRVAIKSFDERIEQVAFTLGASKLRVLWSVVLPNLVPSAVAAWIFAFIISFDEVVVTLFLSGTYMTIPKRMFNELIMQINPTITAIATILIGINTLAVYLLVLFMRRGGILGKRLT
jgi:ABC-type spermidine/putrescine transport system permease subunit II